MLKDMSPYTKAFLIGMFLGAAFGTIYAICEIAGEGGGEIVRLRT